MILYRTLNYTNSYSCNTVITTAIRARLTAKSHLDAYAKAKSPTVTLTGKVINYDALEQINSIVKTSHEMTRAVSTIN